jgi:putative salt-induced outer membrane protein YdiY
MKVLKLIILVYIIVHAATVDLCMAAEAWSPAAPADSNDFDWIQVKSGEWLKGRIKSMQDEELEFDSEELDVHIWDWKDILILRSPKLLAMRFEDNRVMYGSLQVTADEARITNINGTQMFPRSYLLGITPTGQHEWNNWTVDISFGMTNSAGNTREVTSNANVKLRRLTPSTRQSLEFLGNYGKLYDEVNKDDQRWTGKADFFLSRRFFIRVLDAEYYHDSMQNIAYRLTLGGSVGYDLIKTKRTEWDVTAGPAFQRDMYDSVEAGTDKREDSWAFVLAGKFETDLTKRVDLTLESRGQFTSKETGSNMQHTVGTLEYEIHKHLTLDLSYVWDHISAPTPGSDGVMPEKDDFQFIMSLGIHL